MLIGELARRAGLSKDGVRHYERLGIIQSSTLQAGSRFYREYDQDALLTIDKVRHAQKLGLSLKEIASLLKALQEGGIASEQAISFLTGRLVVIRRRIDELHAAEQFVLKKIEAFGGLSDGEGRSARPNAHSRNES